MKLAIGSGKGGVGKSVVAASLISILSKQYKLLCMDCDVDAPNLDLMIGVDKFDEIKEVQASAIAKIDYNKCIGCGECYENCRYPHDANRLFSFRWATVFRTSSNKCVWKRSLCVSDHRSMARLGLSFP